MKKHLFVITSLVSLAGAVAVGLFLSAEPSPYGTPQDATSPVSFEMLPETVKNGLVTASGNGVIRRIARRITDDVTVYEADVENNGKLFEITLTATGAVLAITAEDSRFRLDI